MSAPLLTLATATAMSKEDFDLPPLLQALTAAQVPTQVLAWDDPAAQPAFATSAACLLRSTWNYIRQLDRFLAWIEETAAVTTLWNPAPVVRWNSHKGYLLELEARGIPIVPTRLLVRGSAPALEPCLATWPEVVVKPAVGAGSFATLRVSSAEASRGAAHLATHLRDRDMLVQRYEPAVEGPGERSLVWIDGAFTHAVRKQARFSGDAESVSQEAVPIADDERALATRALAAVPHPLLYARVDLVRDGVGEPRLMELELIEPSLFFSRAPESAPRLAAAVARQLARGG